MEPIEGINLKKLVEECEISLKKELEKGWQHYQEQEKRRIRVRWLQKIFGTKENKEKELEELYEVIRNEN